MIMMLGVNGRHVRLQLVKIKKKKKLRKFTCSPPQNISGGMSMARSL